MICVTAVEVEEVEGEEEEEYMEEAYVTLATNDVYAVGAMVLAYSIRSTCTERHLVVMVTPEVSSPMREVLAQFFDVIFDVSPIDSNDFDNLSLLNRQDITDQIKSIYSTDTICNSENVLSTVNYVGRRVAPKEQMLRLRATQYKKQSPMQYMKFKTHHQPSETISQC